MGGKRITPIKPGAITPKSGIWESTRSKQRTTLDKGEKAPPTPHAGEKWKIKIKTNP